MRYMYYECCLATSLILLSTYAYDTHFRYMRIICLLYNIDMSISVSIVSQDKMNCILKQMNYISSSDKYTVLI